MLTLGGACPCLFGPRVTPTGAGSCQQAQETAGGQQGGRYSSLGRTTANPAQSQVYPPINHPSSREHRHFLPARPSSELRFVPAQTIQAQCDGDSYTPSLVRPESSWTTTRVTKLSLDPSGVMRPYSYETYKSTSSDMANRKIETLTRGLIPMSMCLHHTRPSGSYAPVRMRYVS